MAVSLEWWKSFLLPLSDRQPPNPLKPKGKPEIPPEEDDSLVGIFLRRLDVQNEETKQERIQAVEQAKSEITKLLSPGKTFEDLEVKWKRYQEALKKKSDRETSGSLWEIETLAKYITREELVFVSPQFQSLTDGELKEIKARIVGSLKALFGEEVSFSEYPERIEETTLLEADIRMLIDALLQPLCVARGLTIRTEQSFRSPLIPTSICDYVIYFGDNRIGVVEAKRPGTLIKKSVAQIILQLLSLSRENPQRCHFGVLTDGLKFILIGVSAHRVIFFQEEASVLHPLSLSPSDYESLAGALSWLFDVFKDPCYFNQITD